jgi:ATP-dependent Lhr-like helicase
LLALETEGRILRGRFTPDLTPSREGAGMRGDLEWCDRRLLARIHRYTLNRLRAEIEAVSAADFMRFLLHWQHVAGGQQARGTEGLAAILEQLDGYELAAAAWESHVLPARVSDYGGEQIDALCLSGRVAWGRLTPMDGMGKTPLKSSPIALMMREHAALWRVPIDTGTAVLTSAGSAVHDVLAEASAAGEL